MNEQIAIGVDVGGSHISCAAYNITEKKYLDNTFVENDLDNHAQPAVIIEVWGKTISETMYKAGCENVEGIGFAMPGPYDYVNGISLFTGQNGKYENTYGMNVPAELRKYLDLPDGFKIRFINDATAFAIGEDQAGMAKNYNRSLSVTLGTGFGSAFIKNGLPVTEGDEVPDNGCLWHLPFKGGIADDYFSTRGLIARFLEKSGLEVDGVKQIAEMAENNRFAGELFADFGEQMGIFLEPWIRKFGIEAFVMGGNISRAYSLFGGSLNQYLLRKNIDLKIFISELREVASFIGSATLINDSFYERVLPVIKTM